MLAKATYIALFFAALSSCAPTKADYSAHYLESPSPIDRNFDSATIEDYILAVPIYRLHEGTREGFEEAVRTARLLPQNQGKPANELYLPGDGSMGPHEFSLNRESRTLTAKVIGDRADEVSPSSTDSYQRVPGGWLYRHE